MKKLLLIALMAISLASCKKEQQTEVKPDIYEYEVYGYVNYVFYEPNEKSQELKAGTNYRTVEYTKGQSVTAIIQFKNPIKQKVSIKVKKNGVLFINKEGLDYLSVNFVVD